MKNIFLAFIFIVLSFTAHSVFAQDVPLPSCQSVDVKCRLPTDGFGVDSARNACAANDGYFFIGSSTCSGNQNNRPYTCNYGNCTCPEGWAYSSGLDVNGNYVSGCSSTDDGGQPGGDDCEYGSDSNGVCYPPDCPFGDGTPEACSNNSSSSSSVPPVCVPPYYNDPVTGQCVIEESDSSASSAASSEGGASSSAGGSSSGNASSSGDSGSSAGNDSGDGDGDGDSGGGGSSSGGGTGGGGGGSGSSAGAGECDPESKEYAACIGYTEDAEGKDTEYINKFEQQAGDEMDSAYEELTTDIENFSGIDGEMKDAPEGLRAALLAFIPSSGSCTPIQFTFMGNSESISCELFEEFRLIFGWFLTLMAVGHIWSIATKPVER